MKGFSSFTPKINIQGCNNLPLNQKKELYLQREYVVEGEENPEFLELESGRSYCSNQFRRR